MKLRRTLALMTALAGLAGTVSMVDAQEPKPKPKAKADDKKADKKKDGTVEVYQGKSGWRYRIKDADDKVLAMPSTAKNWEKKEDVIKAIDELKTILNTVKPTEAKD